MKHRTALATLVAAASLLGAAGMSQAHPRDEGYSPCRPGSDEHRLGYEHTEGHDDPRGELPTIYANGNADTMSGNAGICSGNIHGHTGQPPYRGLEIGNDAEGPYVEGDSPETDPIEDATDLDAEPVTPENDLGSVTVGDDYIEVDGSADSPLAESVEQSDGYLSAGTNEHTDDGQDGTPGVCMSGNYNRAHYDQPGYRSGQDCNAAIIDEENRGYLTGVITG